MDNQANNSITQRQKFTFIIAGIAVGIIYGVLARYVFGILHTLASITYVFLTPAVLGVVPLMFASREQLRSYKNIIFIPWLTLAAFFLATVALQLEGLICLMLLAAPFFLLVTAGAFVFRLIRIHRDKNRLTLATIVILPFLLAPFEAAIDNPSEVFMVEDEIVIRADAEEIWSNIVEVPEIQQSEYNEGFFHWLGIPRPLIATVDKKAVGGKRLGNFEGGLKFVETITQYDLNKSIAFDIWLDPATVAPRVFDQHVLNGNYFTFVNAGYTLTDVGNNQIKLTLSSSYQLTSKINLYGKFWGDMVLHDFQQRLLVVIKNRCER